MISDFDKKIISRLQEDIPIITNPYKDIAKELSMDEDVLIDKIRNYSETGILKRIGAILYHRKAGFKANAMVVWKMMMKD